MRKRSRIAQRSLNRNKRFDHRLGLSTKAMQGTRSAAYLHIVRRNRQTAIRGWNATFFRVSTSVQHASKPSLLGAGQR
jgi:hypothetical protein